MAQDAFLDMQSPEAPEDRRAQLRQALLQYRERDTRAMVRIAHRFQCLA
jgi:hypothetical protein